MNNKVEKVKISWKENKTYNNNNWLIDSNFSNIFVRCCSKGSRELHLLKSCNILQDTNLKHGIHFRL